MMCTLVLLSRPGHPWPVVLAANRDEDLSRPWLPPARHWPDRPEVLGGIDLVAGGSWLAVNDHGVVAAVLNRRGTLGPAPGRRSRGALVLEALRWETAEAAAAAMRELDPRPFRPFNLLLADRRSAFWLCFTGEGRLEGEPVPPGLHMFTTGARNDPDCPRIRRHRDRFLAAPPPDPERGAIEAWAALLGDHAGAEEQPHAAMCVHIGDYGTVCSALLALAAAPRGRVVWLQADGPPHGAPFRPLSGGDGFSARGSDSRSGG